MTLLACSWFICSLLLVTLSQCREVNFDDIFVNDPVLEEYIPKISHFVFSQVKPISWLEYAAIRSSAVYFGAQTINIWVPKNTTFEGEIWNETLAIPGATVREVEMPTKIYGNDLRVLAHVSDVVRLEAMYNEGGIYMDYNAFALRSFDDIIYGNQTKNTVMGREIAGLCNAMFMSKRHAPFLREWMSSYKNFVDGDWMGLSVVRPWELYQEGAQDLTVLPKASWFYPSYLDKEKVWLGQSWARDIQNNYGVHMWGTFRQFYDLMTPEAVREIDTPLFCRTRRLFDNVGGPYIAQSWQSNPNCSFVSMETLVQDPKTLMGSYVFVHDSNIKLVDSSGNRLHGWAPAGTAMPLEDGLTVREFRAGHYAWLPVPQDYDGRRGALHMDMMFQIGDHRDSYITFSRLRLDAREVNLYWRFLWHEQTQRMEIELEWKHDHDEKHSFKLWRYIPFVVHDDRYHTFSLAWDRLDLGLICVRVDNTEILRESISLIDRTLLGEELWINSVSDTARDMNLRARLRNLRTYGAGNFDRNADDTIPTLQGKTTMPIIQELGFATTTAAVCWVLLCVFLLVMLAILRRRRSPRTPNRIKQLWRRWNSVLLNQHSVGYQFIGEDNGRVESGRDQEIRDTEASFDESEHAQVFYKDEK